MTRAARIVLGLLAVLDGLAAPLLAAIGGSHREAYVFAHRDHSAAGRYGYPVERGGKLRHSGYYRPVRE